MSPNLRLALVFAICCIKSSSADAAIITQWNFNGESFSASTGDGIATGFGVTTSFISGAGSSDPNVLNRAVNSTSYPSAASANRSEGIQFLAGTVGFQNISFSWDQQSSNTASRVWAIDYTLDGVNWVQLPGSYENTFAAAWINGRTADFSSITGANNNANFGVRILSIFAPSTSSYLPTNPLSTYSGGGTARFDMATFSGTAIPAAAVPEPSAVGLFGLVAVAGAIRSAHRNRRRCKTSIIQSASVVAL